MGCAHHIKKVHTMGEKCKHFVPYHTAKQYVNEHAPHVKSRKQYIKWHKTHNPGFLPVWPHRVWEDFSWNDFLNTTNSFEKTLNKRIGKVKRYRNMWEAIRWAQAQAKHHNITTQQEWIQWYEEHEVPDDIPKRPTHVYEEFPGWMVWLGKTAQAHVTTAKEGQVSVLALHHVANQPKNVVIFKVWSGGMSEIQDFCPDQHGSDLGKIVKLYKFEQEMMPKVVGIMQNHASQQGDWWICTNLHEILWELMEILDLITTPYGERSR